MNLVGTELQDLLEKHLCIKNPSYIDFRKQSLSKDWENVISRDIGAQEKRKSLLENLNYHRKLNFEFTYGSEYTGPFNVLGMMGKGKYIFHSGCEYEGGFEDGMFHGEGTLTYPMGQKLEGLWEKGKMVAYRFTNTDGLDYEANWNYCVMPDRRFNISIREGLQPAGREFMTNQQPERPMETGCYDTGDGYYNATSRSIIPAREVETPLAKADSGSVTFERIDDQFWVNAVTMVSDTRHQWIMDHCRKSWDEPAGYRPDLYERWTTGRRKELEEMDAEYNLENASVDMPYKDEDQQTATSSMISDDPRLSTDEGFGRMFPYVKPKEV